MVACELVGACGIDEAHVVAVSVEAIAVAAVVHSGRSFENKIMNLSAGSIITSLSSVRKRWRFDSLWYSSLMHGMFEATSLPSRSLMVTA